MKTHVREVRGVIEWDIPTLIWQGQETNHKGCILEILQHSKALTCGDRCLWLRHWHWFTADVRGHALWALGIARQFGSTCNHICQQKSVQYGVVAQQNWEESIRYNTRAYKAPPLLFCKGISHHWPQAAGSHDQQGCGNIVTVATAHHAVYTPIQCMYPMSSWFWTVHSGLTIVSQPQREPKPWSTRHELEYTQHQDIGRHPPMHLYRRLTNSNRGWSGIADATEYIISRWMSTRGHWGQG